jgi:hypothetical protein
VAVGCAESHVKYFVRMKALYTTHTHTHTHTHIHTHTHTHTTKLSPWQGLSTSLSTDCLDCISWHFLITTVSALLNYLQTSHCTMLPHTNIFWITLFCLEIVFSPLNDCFQQSFKCQPAQWYLLWSLQEEEKPGPFSVTPMDIPLAK